MRKDILRLAWPVFIGQMAVMLNGMIDTVMVGRLSAVDMAAIGIGVSIYITVYIGLMGTLLGLSPIVAQHYGAGRHAEIGASFQQALWLSVLLSVLGCLALVWTGPWLALASPPPEVAELVQAYLWAVAAGLPPALLFRAFYALNTAISRPQVVMYINLVGVILKVPLNALFMYGWEDVGLPALGGAGCGVATSLIAWLSAGLACLWLVLDREYTRFALLQRSRPDRARMGELLRLGLPIGAAYTVEITSFTFMALFLARLGATASASHQVAANLTGLCYMGGLALANATSTLVAQRIGAGQAQHAKAYAISGLKLALGLAVGTALVLLAARLPIAHAYTSDMDVVRASLPLIAAVGIFHVFDSMQTQFGFILRAYKIAVLPMLVYVLAMWVIGLGGGWWLTFGADPQGALGVLNGARTGALGFWVAGSIGLIAATAGLGWLTLRLWRQEDRRAAGAVVPAGQADQPAS